jgi:tetratricopeptide (TPR) repeat protein
VTDQVLARAEGNPLFLEELARAVLDDDGATSGTTIPDTVHAVIAARIDRLSPEDRHLLRAAAVVGRDVPVDVLERVAGVEPEPLRAGLGRLQAAEFLFERRGRAEPTVGFKHALTQAAAYQGLSGSSRQRLHLRVLEVLEAAAGERRAEMLEALAHHAAAGADWAKAVTCFREAGLRALARDAYREAVHCHESALAALTQMPQDPAARARGCDIRFELAEALYRQGALDRVMKTAREAHAQAEGLGDRPRVAYALGMLAHWHTNEGRYGEALEAGERSLALAESLGLTIVRIWTGIILGRACHALGRYARGIEYLRASLGAIGEDGDRRFAVRGVVPPSPQARTYLALCLSRTGDLDEALQVAEEAVRVGEALGGASDRAWAYYALGRVHHARTDWIRAVPLLERAVALCEADGVAAYFPRLLSGLGSAYAQSGRVAEALPLLERALEASRAMRFAYGQTLIIAQLGTTCVDAGRLDEAAEHAARALAIARERGERGEEAWALLLAGDAAAHRAEPDLDGARAWYEKALALGEELGMRPLAARCRLGLGELERRAGRPEAARAHFRRAADDADGMGIASWRTRARQELERL